MSNQLSMGAIAGGVDSGLTAAGTTLATALALNAHVNVVTTTAASSGVSLPANRSISAPVVVVNEGANSLSVYPPSSTTAINGGSAGAAFAVGAGKTATFWPIGSDNYVAQLGA
jgi:hypothetical protein